jgi:hypothetical protein
MNAKKLLAIFLTLFVFLGNPLVVLAQELEITGNADNSISSVQVASNNNTQVVQNSNLNITNTVGSTANTGNNSVDQNSAGAAISTGDSTTKVNVSTTVNTSGEKVTPASTSENAGISRNGSNSNNTIATSITNTNIITTTNIANITTSIKGVANTGYNSATHNSGAVSIATGNIKSQEMIQNVVNNSFIFSFPQSSSSRQSSLISSNGANSVNNIASEVSKTDAVVQNSVANIANISNWFLNTGYNIANENIGGVSINTGNIFAEIVIKNAVNQAKVIIKCPSSAPVGAPAPEILSSSPQGISNSSNSTSSGNGGPSVLGLSNTSSYETISSYH